MTSPFAPIPEHRESERGHSPTSDSLTQSDRSADAILDSETGPTRAPEPLPDAPASTNSRSSLPLGDSRSAVSIPDAGCQLCGRSLPDSVPACAHRAEHRRDTSGHELAFRTVDMGVSDLAYPHYTTASLKPKDLVGIPWMVAFALRADGWYLRQDIIWSKPNPMPESVTDRCTKAHEYLFLLTKSARITLGFTYLIPLSTKFPQNNS